MMKRFKDVSIRRKLISISMLTSAVALFFALIVIISVAFFATRTTTQERIASLARVIGTNCVAAITFDDPDAARETLKALTAEPEIAYAVVYKADGSLFSAYERNGTEAQQVSNTKLNKLSASQRQLRILRPRYIINYQFGRGELNLIEPIILEGKVIGAVEVSSDLKTLYQRMQITLLVCIGVLLIAFFIAFMVSVKVQRTISEPVGTLTRIMNTVSQEKDYSLRAEKMGDDELGMLFDGFNEMLSEIQARDQKLHFTQFSVDHMSDAALWMDESARVVNVNNAAVEILGYTREKLLGMVISDIDPNLGLDRWAELWHKVRRRKALSFESNLLKQEGKFIPVEVYANFLSYQGREYICAFARDIADRKALQFQLEQAQKMEAIGTLAGGVAHDLNNILGGLVGYPDLLLMDMAPDNPMHRPLSMVKKSGEKAAAIVQDMLTLARRGVDLRTAVNLNEIVSDYLKSPEQEKVSGYHTKVSFEAHLDPELPNILGSEVHLSKTVMNLVANAAEAMADGGPVTISTFFRQLNEPLQGFQTVAEGEYAVLRVQDQGLGIDEEDLANIFEPFYTKKKMGRSGTGLGMSVVSGTVKDHRGFIDLKSSRGRGTCFDLYFPITHQILQERAGNFEMEDFSGTERILVVDDVQEQREVATLILSRLGYNVTSVESGEAAVAYLQKHDADLLVLDMIMDPGMDGLETYKRVAAFRPGQKAVIASGFAETDRVRELMIMGAGAYVKKPYNMETLGRAVRETLKK